MRGDFAQLLFYSVNLKAKKNGEYTLTVLGTESSQFSVLSLIDHLTGPGVYVLRLVDEANVKTQKIVIR